MSDAESDRRLEALETRVQWLEQQFGKPLHPPWYTGSLVEGFRKIRAEVATDRDELAGHALVESVEPNPPGPSALSPATALQPPPLPVMPMTPPPENAPSIGAAADASLSMAAQADVADSVEPPQTVPSPASAASNMYDVSAPIGPHPVMHPLGVPMNKPPRPMGPAPGKPSKPVGVSGFEFERALGLKWTGWIGAIVLIIGASLGVKFLYDQGWLQKMPPVFRLAMITTAGMALLAVGEWVRRRIDRVPGASLMGAGVATLFLASYAGHAYYNLYDPGMALVLTCAVTLIGAAVAWWGNLVSIAVLSIVGGSLIPLLVNTAQPKLGPFLGYLLMMQIVGLSLAYLGSTRRWWTLRGLTLATTSFWMTEVLLNTQYAGQIGTLLCFAAVYALASHGELVATAWRRRIDQLPDWAPGVMLCDAGANFSTLVTGLLTAALLWILRDQSTVTRTSAVLAVAAGCAALSMGMKRVAWPLAMGYAVQSAALLVVALPVALSGLWLVIGWAVLAVALSTLGALMDRQVSRIAGIATWILAGLDAMGYLDGAFGHGARALPWITVLGQGITPALTVCWIVALVGQAVAWLTSGPATDGRPERTWAWYLALASALLWTAASMEALPFMGATLSLVVLAWILAVADIGSGRMSWAVQGMGALLLASVKWVAIDAVADRLSTTWRSHAHMPWFNASMEMAVLLAASLPAMYWMRRSSLRKVLSKAGKDYRETSLIYAIWFTVVGLMTVGLSLQVDLIVQRAVDMRIPMAWPADQYEQLLLMVLWTSASVALWGAGKWADRTSYIESRTLFGQWMTVLLACKFLLLDTLFWRMGQAPADVTVMFNAQTLVGALLVAALAVESRRASLTFVRNVAGFLSILIVLWVGTLEIDRAFGHILTGRFTDPQRAREVAISIFWSVFAVACVAWGFKTRSAPLRFFGLALFGVTLLKVLFIDMGELGAGYRILSFLGLGLLLLGTSVLYGKLSPRLLGEQR